MNQRLKDIIKVLKDNHIASGLTPEKLNAILEELGPTFIKIGQILSTRVDLLPEEYIQHLSKLRSNAIPLDYEEVRTILLDVYPNIDDYFSIIDPKPIGSASIAQVHLAYLTSGEKVVIKVKRPNIDTIIMTDLNLLKQAVNYLQLNRIIKVIDLNLVLDEIYITTLKELNFKEEVHNLVQFFENNNKIPYISSPKVYKELCSENTIVMEYIDGFSINQISDLVDNGYNLKTIALLLSENYIHQALDDGFFHADPHPDNIKISGDNIVFLDLGMIGVLSNKNKKLLKDCMRAIIESNYSEVARILVEMSKHNVEVDYMNLQRDVKKILSSYASSSLDSINLSIFIKDMFCMLQGNHLVLDQDITMLIRGISIIEAVLNKLDSKINLIQVLANKLEKESLNEIISTDSVKKFSKSLLNTSNSVLKLPGELSNLISSISNGEIKFKVEFSNSMAHIDKLEKLLHELIIAFLDGVLIVCLCLSHDGIQKYILFFFVLILSIWLFIKMLIDRIHNGY